MDGGVWADGAEGGSVAHQCGLGAPDENDAAGADGLGRRIRGGWGKRG